MSNVTIRMALRYVARNPEPKLEPLDMPVWEHIARTLYDIANNPDPRVRGAMTRATRAQEMILTRTGGKRRAGTQPIRKTKDTIIFRDLTAGAIEHEQ